MAIIYSEFLLLSAMINKETLRRLLRSVREVRRKMWQDNTWLFQHGNAFAHNALSNRQFLTEKYIAVMEQPPDSQPPDWVTNRHKFGKQFKQSFQQLVYCLLRKNKLSTVFLYQVCPI